MQNCLKTLWGDARLKTDVVIEPTLAGRAEEIVARAGLAERQVGIVMDENTAAALGERIARETGYSICLLPGRPHADAETVATIRAMQSDALIAVGSGTISDLCKYASFLDTIPYIVFPTAPSMNGYLSANASITVGGHKSTLPAHLPAGVYCDCSVLASAPRRLVLAGLGDSICRPTAQADWLLSHLLLNTAYDETPFHQLVPFEAELFTHSDRLAAGDPRMADYLIRTLLVSGLGMTLAGGSYPASQGEHLIAHTLEMIKGEAESFHGEQIGVTTLAMAALQENTLASPLRLPAKPDFERRIRAYFPQHLWEAMDEASAQKYAFYVQAEKIQTRLTQEEEIIRERIRAITVPEKTLRRVLEQAGAPVTPEAVGWSAPSYDSALRHARFTRNRFTFLDMAL